MADDDRGSLLDEGPRQSSIGGRDLTRWPTPAGRSAVRVAEHLHRSLSPDQVLYLTLAAGLLVLGVATALAALVYDAVADADGVSLLDRPVLDLAKSLRTPALTGVARLLDLIGGPVGMTVLATLVAIGLARLFRSWTSVVLVAVTAAGSVTATSVGKAVIGRVRPPFVDAVPPFQTSPAFPSGHSLNAAAISGIVAYLLVRRLERAWQRALTVALAVAFSLLMGLSRVYLGQHWLTDVLVAWALGVAWVSLVVIAHRIFLTLRRGHSGASRAA